MTDSDAIHAATATLLKAVSSADVAGVISVWAEDGVLMPPHHAPIRGRPAIQEYFQRLFDTARFRFVFTASEITVDASSARAGQARTGKRRSCMIRTFT